MKELLDKLEKNNVHVSLVKNDLKVRFSGAQLSEEFILELKANKESIVDYLKSLPVYSSYLVLSTSVAKKFYELSSAQKRLCFLQEFDPQSTSYNMPMVTYLGTSVDKARLQRALEQLVARHESLRTSFEKVGGELMQHIHPHVPLHLEQHRCLTAEFTAYLQAYIRPFALSQAPLLRSSLVELVGQGFVWIVDMHHLISDGTSHQLLAQDFLRLYRGETLAPLPFQYRDFSEWQNALLASGELDSQKAYWRAQFATSCPPLNLPTDRPRPASFTFQGASERFVLDASTSAALQALGQHYQGSLQMTLLAILQVVLYKYTGQQDLVIGCGVAGRRHPDVEHIVGMFVNTLPIRSQLRGELSFAAFLQHVIARSLAAYDNQDVQFEELVDLLRVERDASRNPLFDISLVVQNFDRLVTDAASLINSDDATSSTSSLTQSAIEQSPSLTYELSTSKFDMTWFIVERGADIVLEVEYYSAIYEASTIRRLITHFQHVIQQVTANRLILLDQISLVSVEEEQFLLTQFALGPELTLPAGATLHGLFEQQCRRTPQQLAVRDQDGCLTYQQLDEQANQFARFLLEALHVQPEEKVALLQARTRQTLVCLLGILKAGAAYVPLESEHPVERLLYLLADAQASVLVTDKAQLELANQLQWRSPALKHLVCADSEAIYQEQPAGRGGELMRKDLWDHIGETASTAIAAGGWLSSYTGEYLSELEMQEYSQNAYLKLAPYLHADTRVLEIGCASGLTLFAIAPHVGFYYGTDLSSTILARTQREVAQQGLTNVALACLPAHQLDELDAQEFDLVIINSVVQAFSGHNYLRQVLVKAIGKLKAKGRIFLGDLMDEAQRGALLADLARFQHAHPEAGYRTKTDFSAELFVAKEYLLDLTAQDLGIADVRFSQKIHTLANELTRYRYDALLEVDQHVSQQAGPRHRYQHDQSRVQGYPVETLELDVSSENLAYVIYTSGSTGKPKGVLIEHRAIANTIAAQQLLFEAEPAQRGLQFASLAFDASIWEIFQMISSGGCLYIISEELKKSPLLFEQYVGEHQLEVATLPPAYLALLDVARLRPLAHLITAGEAALADKARAFNAAGTYYNAYGPTETSICATIWKRRPGVGIAGPSVPIGRPIHNTQVYVLDEHQALCPVGVVGELCLGGAGLARGYLNQPELTAQQFIAHPFLAGERLYRSGDRGRWLADGNLEFMGRLDEQVKLRGYRIELGEIEQQLLSYPDLLAAVVVARPDQHADTELVAYVVASKLLNPARVRTFLSRHLPEYMLPQHYVQLDALPLTSSGKVDKKALPDPQGGPTPAGAAYLAPRTETEHRLVAIWQQVLGRERVGVQDNFFEIGGNSIKILRLSTLIKEKLDITVGIAILFQYPTIEDLAQYFTHGSEVVEEETFTRNEIIDQLQKFNTD